MLPSAMLNGIMAAASEAILKYTKLRRVIGLSKSLLLLASVQANHGKGLRLILLHTGGTGALAAVETLAELSNQ